MVRPFYTAPSLSVVREEVNQIFRNRPNRSRKQINLIKNLDEVAEKSTREIHTSRVTKSQLQQAMALGAKVADWDDSIFSCETVEHDDFTQIRNPAKY